ENTVLITKSTAVPAACPERALSILYEAESGEGRAGHSGSVAGVEYLESHTIETNYPTVCRKPKVPVARVPYRKNGVVWQPVFRVVDREAFLTQGAGSGEKEAGPATHIRLFSNRRRTGIGGGRLVDRGFRISWLPPQLPGPDTRQPHRLSG